MSLLAIEPGIPASRICHVIGFDKGPVSRTLAGLKKRGLVSIRTDGWVSYGQKCLTHFTCGQAINSIIVMTIWDKPMW